MSEGVTSHVRGCDRPPRKCLIPLQVPSDYSGSTVRYSEAVDPNTAPSGLALSRARSRRAARTNKFSSKAAREPAGSFPSRARMQPRLANKLPAKPAPSRARRATRDPGIARVRRIAPEALGAPASPGNAP